MNAPDLLRAAAERLEDRAEGYRATGTYQDGEAEDRAVAALLRSFCGDGVAASPVIVAAAHSLAAVVSSSPATPAREVQPLPCCGGLGAHQLACISIPSRPSPATPEGGEERRDQAWDTMGPNLHTAPSPVFPEGGRIDDHPFMLGMNGQGNCEQCGGRRDEHAEEWVPGPGPFDEGTTRPIPSPAVSLPGERPDDEWPHQPGTYCIADGQEWPCQYAPSLPGEQPGEER